MIWCYFSSSICRKDLCYQCLGQIWALCHLARIFTLCSEELHPPTPSWLLRMNILGHPALINTSLCFSWRQLGGWTCWQGHHQAAPPLRHRHHPQQIPDPENLHVSNHHHQWNPLCLLEGGEGNLHSDLVSIRVCGAQSEGSFWRTWQGLSGTYLMGRISVGRGLRKQVQLAALLLPPSLTSNLVLPIQNGKPITWCGINTKRDFSPLAFHFPSRK